MGQTAVMIIGNGGGGGEEDNNVGLYSIEEALAGENGVGWI